MINDLLLPIPRINRDYYNPYEEYNLTSRFIHPESPETAVARANPYEATRLLRELSNDRVNEKALETAEVIAKGYLDTLSQKRIDESRGMKISFSRNKTLKEKILGDKVGFNLSIELN